MTIQLPRLAQLKSSPVEQRPIRWGIMDRYIFTALLMPFLFGLGAFLAISLTLGSLFELLREVTDNGLPLLIALQVLGLQMPKFLVLALPMAILLATLTIFNQLSRNSELIALRNCGASVTRLITPALCLSALVMVMTFGVNEFVVPVSNQQATQILNQALDRQPPAFQEKNIFYREFKDDQLQRVFYARRFDGEWMRDLTVLNFEQGNLQDITVTDMAHWSQSLQGWNMIHGTVYRLAPDQGTYQTVSHFQQDMLPLSRAPLDLATETRSPEEMGLLDTRKLLKLVERSGDRRRTRQLRVQLHNKFAFPWISVVFGLVGATLGIQDQRQASTKGFGLSLMIIFGYYTLAFVTRSLGEIGILPAVMAAWLPAIAGLLMGGGLLWRANQH